MRTPVPVSLAVSRLLLGCTGILFAMALAEAALRLLPLPAELNELTAWQGIPGAAWQDPAWETTPLNVYRIERGRGIAYDLAPDQDEVIRLAEHSGGSFHFRTNNLGLRRDGDTAVDKPTDLFRVVMLGDSHTGGYVDNAETFSTLLEISLNDGFATTGQRFEVLNGGVGGYGPTHERFWFRVNGAQLKPDLVVVVYYAGNDLEWWRSEGWRRAKAEQERAAAEQERSLDLGRLLRQVHLLSLARNTLYNGPLTWLWQRLFPIDDAMVQVRRICPGCYDQSLVQIDQGPRDPQALQESVRDTAAVLVGLEREVRLNGGRLAVAVLPTRFQVEPDLAGADYRKAAALLGLGDGDLGYDDEVVRGLLAELDAAGVPTVPLQEALRAARKGEAFYYSRDWHLNPAGHRAAAAALEQALLSLGLLAIGGR